VRLDDALADGEAESEAAGLPRTGLVRTIEAVEEMPEVLGIDGGAGVVDGELGSLPCVAERDHDRRAFGRILRRVVHEGAYGATELVLIGTEAYALLDVRVYRAASLERDRIEFQHAFVNELAQVEILSGKGALGGSRGGLIGTCEDEKLFDEALHGTRLVSGAVDPAHRLTGDVVVALEDPRVGDNHRERRLELVRGVRDEATLTLPGILDRLEHP